VSRTRIMRSVVRGVAIRAMRMSGLGVRSAGRGEMAGVTMTGVEVARAVAAKATEEREQKGRREAANEAGYEHPVHRCVHFDGPGLLSSRKTCGDTGFRYP